MGIKNWVNFLLVIAGTLTFLSTANATDEATQDLPLTLKAAAERALEQSIELAQFKFEKDGSDASAKRAWSGFYPKLEIQASGGTFHDRVPNPGDTVVPTVARDRNNYTGQILFTQSLFAGFADSATVSAARSAARAANVKVVLEKNTVIDQVIELYFGVQLRSKQIEAEEEAAVLRQTQLHDIRARVSAGVSIDMDRLQSEYVLKTQEPVLESLRSDLELTSLRLSRLLGYNLDVRLILSDSLESANAVLSTSEVPPLAEAFKQAMSQNLDKVKLEADVDSFDSESRKIAAKHLPTLDLQLAAGTNAYMREDIATQDSLTYSGQLVLNIPIFSGFDSVYERQERAAGEGALKKREALLREKILNDLDAAYHTWKLALSRITSETASVRLADEASRRSRSMYRVGRSTATETLDVYQRLVEAKKSLAQAMYDRIISLSKIRTLLGNRFPL
jgi:outer membrane protein TolC